METISENIETEENEYPQKVNFYNSPSSMHLAVYLAGIVIFFWLIVLTIQWTIKDKKWSKTVKYNQVDREYYRHPKIQITE